MNGSITIRDMVPCDDGSEYPRYWSTVLGAWVDSRDEATQWPTVSAAQEHAAGLRKQGTTRGHDVHVCVVD